MSKTTFSYTVLRYVHDAAAEEFLNVGIVLFAPSARFVRAIIQPEYSRLSTTFQDFYGEYYRKIARHIGNQINGLADKWLAELPFNEMPTNAQELANLVLPADDSSLRFSEPRGGITSDPEATLHDLFDRLVLRNQPHGPSDKRTSDEVWKTFRDRLAPHSVLTRLQPVVIAGGSFEYEFQHAWKNSQWHPLEPLSMDAEKAETIRDRAVRWVGRATDLKADQRLGKLYLLVGPPQLEALKVPYEKALNLLHKMPLDHEIVREDQAEGFAEEFGKLVETHEP